MIDGTTQQYRVSLSKIGGGGGGGGAGRELSSLFSSPSLAMFAACKATNKGLCVWAAQHWATTKDNRLGKTIGQLLAAKKVKLHRRDKL